MCYRNTLACTLWMVQNVLSQCLQIFFYIQMPIQILLCVQALSHFRKLTYQEAYLHCNTHEYAEGECTP